MPGAGSSRICVHLTVAKPTKCTVASMAVIALMMPDEPRGTEGLSAACKFSRRKHTSPTLKDMSVSSESGKKKNKA